MPDRAMIEEHLRKSEENVDRGHELIARQRELLAQVERMGGADAIALGRKVLADLERIQATFIANRDRLRKELARATGVEPPSGGGDIGAS